MLIYYHFAAYGSSADRPKSGKKIDSLLPENQLGIIIA
jgi:hypothetical protein